MHYSIQVKDQGSWYTLGGEYTSEEADERVSQFMQTSGKSSTREYRVVKAEDSKAVGRFPAERTSRSPR